MARGMYLPRCGNIADILEQKDKVDKALRREMKPNEIWYIIDLHWWKKWENFCDCASKVNDVEECIDDYPGEIDNNALISDGRLKADLLYDIDITIVPEDVWKLLLDCYGCSHKDVQIFQRRTIETPRAVEIEIYPAHFSFYTLDSNVFLFEGTYSKTMTIGDLKEVISRHHNHPAETIVRLLVRNEKNDMEELVDDDASIEESSLEREKVLYVKFEIKNGLSTGLSQMTAPKMKTFGYFSSSQSVPNFGSTNQCTLTPQATPGICGLSNLGNTCFMNSAIQCLSNVPALTDYFINGHWRKELNKTNPLGSGGKIALAYAELIKQLWSGTRTYAVPRNLKIEIAHIAPQFSGYAQHDSHEVLVFLLDGLHEDLNRVHQKPYAEVKDSDGRADAEVAKEAWDYHQARNNSVVVDLFHGQLKSTVVCPTCKYKSITFDPFASLILPLPEVYKYARYVYVWPWASNHKRTELLRYELILPPAPRVRNVIEALEQQRPVHPGCQYYIPDVYNCDISRPRNSEKPLPFYEGDLPLFIYELAQGNLVPVVWRGGNYNRYFGVPFFISIRPPANKTGTVGLTVSEDHLIKLVIERLKAVGIDPMDYEENKDLDEPLNANNISNLERKAGDRQVLPDLGSSSNPAEHDIQDANSGLPDYHSVTERTKNKACTLDPLSASLRSRLRLEDARGQDLLLKDGSVTLPLGFESTCKLVITCAGMAVENTIDVMMNMIQHTRRPGSRVSQTVNLFDCFERFTDIEELGTRDLWFCRHCKTVKQATKKFDLWRLPDVLVVQLKRFRSHLRVHDKIDSLVEFPISGLDLTDRVLCNNTGERYIYDLVAVSNHMGYLGGGHYTAYALNAQTGRWYLFDDSLTQQINPSGIVTNSAYVLVYVRRKQQLSIQPNLTHDEDYAIPCGNSIDQNVSNSNGHNGSIYSRSTEATNSPHLQDNDLMEVE